MNCPACEARRQATHHQARADRLEDTLREVARNLNRIREQRRTERLAARIHSHLAQDREHTCRPLTPGRFA